MSDQPQQSSDTGGKGGDAPAPWYGSNPDTKAYVEAKGFKDGESAIGSYRNLETLIGADKAGRTVVLPKDEKDADGIKAYRSKIGVPDKPEGYVVPDAFKDSLKDDPVWPLATSTAVKSGLPAREFSSFLGEFLTAVKQRNEDARTKEVTDSESAKAALLAEWGDKADANSELARRVVRAGGIGEDDLATMEKALGTTKFLKMFHSLGTKLAEPGATGTEGASGGAVADAQRQLNDLRARRMDNKVSDTEFAKEADRLGRIIDRAA